MLRLARDGVLGIIWCAHGSLHVGVSGGCTRQRAGASKGATSTGYGAHAATRAASGYGCYYSRLANLPTYCPPAYTGGTPASYWYHRSGGGTRRRILRASPPDSPGSARRSSTQTDIQAPLVCGIVAFRAEGHLVVSPATPGLTVVAQEDLAFHRSKRPPNVGGLPQSQPFVYPSFSNHAKLSTILETLRIGVRRLAFIAQYSKVDSGGTDAAVPKWRSVRFRFHWHATPVLRENGVVS